VRVRGRERGRETREKREAHEKRGEEVEIFVE
jgi:hypothetical protein